MKWIAKENTPILDALAQMAPDSSKSTHRSWLKEKRVLVDGDVVTLWKTILREGQHLSLAPKTSYLPEGIRLLYQDSGLIVIDKPEFVLSVATDFEKEKTAHAILKKEFRPKKVYVVHRLDQDTSGVMLFALNEKVHQALRSEFEKHNVERCYAAIVEGHLSEAEGTWKSYLYEDGNYVVHSTPDTEKGDLAITHYQLLGTSQKYSWLDLRLETGKKNQIRVHCKDAGNPVVGDKKYGAESDPIKRLCLHAYLLGFRHPITKKMLRFKSKIPEKFYKLLKPKMKNFPGV
ncbi:MAG TPA: RluA family pseudouridine synthase [Waddliaceae bacterium]